VTKSNCILFAVPRWIARGRQDQCKYLVIRFGKSHLCIRMSRIPWGFVHFLLGEMDPVTGQLSLTSYKPPVGHHKTGLALTFKGSVVEGDAIVRWVELSEDVTGSPGH
jgi:hypothetical protein